jgi:hypothetical protein
VGATELYVQGHHESDLPLDDLPDDRLPGRWVLLLTGPVNPTFARNWMVRLIKVKNKEDPLVSSRPITHLVWEAAQALPFEMDMTVLEVHGNLVPITAGETHQAHFVVGFTSDPHWQSCHKALKREGPNGSLSYLFSLPDSKSGQLAWLGEDPAQARPEIRLQEVEWDGNKENTGSVWHFKRSLVGTNSSQPQDRDFILDDGFWDRVVGYQRIGQEIIHRDYASGTGTTIRFGDGEFGMIPSSGTVFLVTYRLGGGRRSNVSAGAITGFYPLELTFVNSVCNPFPAINGMDPETPEEVRQLAPEAFRAITYRAVRPEDYAEAAERLDWVERAGATFRWTGSWISAFVTPDPRGAVAVTMDQRRELQHQLDRFRQAGREAFPANPRYADLDLAITICVEPNAYRGETKESVLEALLGKKGPRPRVGFFAADNFTFGTILERSALEATIQAVSGVRAVQGIRIRRRGWFDWRPFTELAYEPGMHEVIRVENDPLNPERGSLRLLMEGGA